MRLFFILPLTDDIFLDDIFELDILQLVQSYKSGEDRLDDLNGLGQVNGMRLQEDLVVFLDQIPAKYLQIFIPYDFERASNLLHHLLAGRIFFLSHFLAQNPLIHPPHLHFLSLQNKTQSLAHLRHFVSLHSSSSSANLLSLHFLTHLSTLCNPNI